MSILPSTKLRFVIRPWELVIVWQFSFVSYFLQHGLDHESLVECILYLRMTSETYCPLAFPLLLALE